MPKLEKILFLVLAVIFIFGGFLTFRGWRSYTSLTGSSAIGQPLNYEEAKQAQDPSDPCKAPPGYTEESWREHMGHHPDEYKQCLSK